MHPEVDSTIKITVIAPTYNRVQTLHRVYESLCLQKYSEGGRFQQVFAPIKAKSEANGRTITVDFMEKGFYFSYSLREIREAT